MLVISLLLFSSLATASRPGVRRRQCVESAPASITQSTSTETNVPEPFLLQIQATAPQSPTRRKRQEPPGSYLEDDSSTSPRCEQGALFQLLNGRLLKNGVVITVSDPPRAQPLLETGPSRDISITFSLTDGVLSWSDPRFPKQTAVFCILADTVYVYFEDAPDSCVDVDLSSIPLSECPGWQALPSTRASSVGSQVSPASGVDVSSPSSAEDDPSQSQTPIFVPTSSQPIAVPQHSTSFVLSPTPYSTSPDTVLPSSTISSSEMLTTPQTPQSSPQFIESLSSSTEALSISTGLTSLSATYTEPAPSSSATRVSTPNIPGTSRTQPSALNTPPSSASSKGPTSLISSSARSSDITSSRMSTSTPKPFPPGNLLCAPLTRENGVKFGFYTDTVGSVGYTGITRADYVAFYATGPITGNLECDFIGYLYHQRSGLCVAGVASSSASFRYQNRGLQLQPCGASSPTPPEEQAWCASNVSGNLVRMLFLGDVPPANPPYGSTNKASVRAPVRLIVGAGDYWFYSC